MKIARWVMGYSKKQSVDCLERSIESFLKFYDVKVIICHNCDPKHLKHIGHELYDQRKEYQIKPEGVSWKLYPPRIELKSHEVVIDNDIVFDEKIEEIEEFFESDSTLMLEGLSRNYGRFEKHVPVGYRINSGVYGMPPNFDFKKYVSFYANKEWQINAVGTHAANRTFDEQGLVALALLDHKNKIIISNKTLSNCENKFVKAKGMHFVGLNRVERHKAYEEYKSSKRKII